MPGATVVAVSSRPVPSNAPASPGKARLALAGAARRSAMCLDDGHRQCRQHQRVHARRCAERRQGCDEDARPRAERGNRNMVGRSQSTKSEAPSTPQAWQDGLIGHNPSCRPVFFYHSFCSRRPQPADQPYAIPADIAVSRIGPLTPGEGGRWLDQEKIELVYLYSRFIQSSQMKRTNFGPYPHSFPLI